MSAQGKNISPATAAALNPATPPLSTHHMNLDSTVDVKKFGGLAEITFLQLVSHICALFFFT